MPPEFAGRLPAVTGTRACSRRPSQQSPGRQADHGGNTEDGRRGHHNNGNNDADILEKLHFVLFGTLSEKPPGAIRRVVGGFWGEGIPGRSGPKKCRRFRLRMGHFLDPTGQLYGDGDIIDGHPEADSLR